MERKKIVRSRLRIGSKDTGLWIISQGCQYKDKTVNDTGRQSAIFDSLDSEEAIVFRSLLGTERECRCYPERGFLA